MRVSVLAATANMVVLSAPLAPNINHKRTAFGGSIVTLGILAAWSLLHVRLVAAGLSSEVVIQSAEVDYDKPITGSFAARSSLDEAQAWPAFLKMLARKKRARIEVQSLLMSEDVPAGHFRGKFIAFLND
jgi:thioesterase domain-containing protein